MQTYQVAGQSGLNDKYNDTLLFRRNSPQENSCQWNKAEGLLNLSGTDLVDLAAHKSPGSSPCTDVGRGWSQSSGSGSSGHSATLGSTFLFPTALSILLGVFVTNTQVMEVRGKLTIFMFWACVCLSPNLSNYVHQISFPYQLHLRKSVKPGNVIV